MEKNDNVASMNPPFQPMFDLFEFNRKLVKAVSLTSEFQTLDIERTPHDVIHEEGDLKLLRYRPIVKDIHAVPVILVYALVNRPYILDLKPDRSVVRSLLMNGFDVSLIDWGNPSPDDKFLTIDDYVNGYIDRAVDAVIRESGAKQVTLLGYCMGGTLSAMYSTLHPEKVRNLIVMAAPIDFEKDGGLLRLWADKKYYNVDRLVDAFGNIPASFLNSGFMMLDPYNNMYSKYMKMIEGIDNQDATDLFMRMEKWVNDGVDMAGETYREFIKKGYQENLLVKGQWPLGSSIVDLSRIDMPLCVIVADYDTLVPKEATLPLLDAVSSKDKKLLTISKGHIGLSVSSEAHRDLWPQVAEWLDTRSAALCYYNPEPNVEPICDEDLRSERKEFPEKRRVPSKKGTAKKTKGAKPKKKKRSEK